MPLRVHPIAGPSRSSDDFAYVRPGGTKPHGGVDVFAEHGTPLVAVDDGTVRFGDDVLGGAVANLYADDGTRYYYAHLSGFSGATNRRVSAGEAIGYVGTTGNAAGTSPHVHFEVHPGNGAAVDPYPLLARAQVAGGAGRPFGLAKAALVVAVLGAIVVAVAPGTVRRVLA